MQDFNDFVKNKEGSYSNNGDVNIFNMINSLATKFDGKSTDELLAAIYKEAKKGKENGTLSNAEIDNFQSLIAPFLDDKKRKLLDKVVKELKKI